LPFILYLLDQSLQSEASFGMLQLFASGICVKLVLLSLVWAYLHHFCAGVRHLLMDFHMGLDKDRSRQSAVIVLVISLGLAAVVGLKMFGVF
ncbi:MAG: succinate dehydrogenase, cytochrome b556 subunit, partial [Undibacterium sp.]|nr:succinate dehydrogenase, cytochrome b556 subunit [Undibacterium sp.]